MLNRSRIFLASAICLAISAPGWAQLGGDSKVLFKRASQTVKEGTEMAEVVVTRTGGGSGAITVRYSTGALSSATSGEDFGHTLGTLSWDDGQTGEQIIAIDIIDDEDEEPTEKINLSLGKVSGSGSIGRNSMVVHLRDNDGPKDDSDGDGVRNRDDACPKTAAGDAPNAEGCSVAQMQEINRNYGGGLLGALAELMANANAATTAFLSGDPGTAGGELSSAIDTFVTRVSNLVSDRGSLPELVGLDDTAPRSVVRTLSAARDVEPVIITGAELPGWSQPAAAGMAQNHFSGFENFSGATTPGHGPRNAHAGIMAYPAGWAPGDAPVNQGGAAVEEIAAFVWKDQAWHEIPVQVDEVYPYFLANGNSTFSFYSGIDLEMSYAWDTESWGMTKGLCEREYDPNGIDVDRPGLYTPFVPGADPNQGVSGPVPDPIAGLDDDDEIVFMARDAGQLALAELTPPGATAVQLVKVNDPLSPQTPRYVYLVTRPQGSSFQGQHYVSYQRDANADQWIDRYFFANDDPEKLGSSNTNYGANLSGTVCPPGGGTRQSSDRFVRDGVTVSTDSYRWYASGRWMVRDLRIREPGYTGTPDASYWASRPDLIDRWKGRAFQQSPDSSVSLVGFEDEQVNWEANSSLIGERCGAVRCMREVWGADSGTNVTKVETFYSDSISYRYRVRVHPIPADGLYTSWDYNRSAMVPTAAETGAGVPAGRYYTQLRPQGVPIDGVNDDIGQVDGFSGFPAFFDAADPTFNLTSGFFNWEQVSAKGDLGSLVYLFELKGATSVANPLVVPYYRDDACLDDGTGDDPVQRPWPGETSTDGRVTGGYEAANGGQSYNSLECYQRQGAHAAHGVHYFFTHDTDNAMAPVTSTEVDGQQWQFMVPSAAPANVGEPYANTVRVPLQPSATPLQVAAP